MNGVVEDNDTDTVNMNMNTNMNMIDDGMILHESDLEDVATAAAEAAAVAAVEGDDSDDHFFNLLQKAADRSPSPPPVDADVNAAAGAIAVVTDVSNNNDVGLVTGGGGAADLDLDLDLGSIYDPVAPMGAPMPLQQSPHYNHNPMVEGGIVNMGNNRGNTGFSSEGTGSVQGSGGGASMNMFDANTNKTADTAQCSISSSNNNNNNSSSSSTGRIQVMLPQQQMQQYQPHLPQAHPRVTIQRNIQVEVHPQSQSQSQSQSQVQAQARDPPAMNSMSGGDHFLHQFEMNKNTNVDSGLPINRFIPTSNPHQHHQQQSTHHHQQQQQQQQQQSHQHKQIPQTFENHILTPTRNPPLGYVSSTPTRIHLPENSPGKHLSKNHIPTPTSPSNADNHIISTSINNPFVSMSTPTKRSPGHLHNRDHKDTAAITTTDNTTTNNVPLQPNSHNLNYQNHHQHMNFQHQKDLQQKLLSSATKTSLPNSTPSKLITSASTSTSTAPNDDRISIGRKAELPHHHYQLQQQPPSQQKEQSPKQQQPQRQDQHQHLQDLSGLQQQRQPLEPPSSLDYQQQQHHHLQSHEHHHQQHHQQQQQSPLNRFYFRPISNNHSDNSINHHHRSQSNNNNINDNNNQKMAGNTSNNNYHVQDPPIQHQQQHPNNSRTIPSNHELPKNILQHQHQSDRTATDTTATKNSILKANSSSTHILPQSFSPARAVARGVPVIPPPTDNRRTIQLLQSLSKLTPKKSDSATPIATVASVVGSTLTLPPHLKQTQRQHQHQYQMQKQQKQQQKQQQQHNSRSGTGVSGMTSSGTNVVVYNNSNTSTNTNTTNSHKQSKNFSQRLPNRNTNNQSKNANQNYGQSQHNNSYFSRTKNTTTSLKKLKKRKKVPPILPYGFGNSNQQCLSHSTTATAIQTATAATISSVASKITNRNHKRPINNNDSKTAFETLPNADDIAKSIPDHASSIFHIFDRRIDLDSLPNDASLYSLLRSWVMDDPYRLQQPCRLLDHVTVPSKRRRVSTIFDTTSIEGDSDENNKNSNIDNDDNNVTNNNGGGQGRRDGDIDTEQDRCELKEEIEKETGNTKQQGKTVATDSHEGTDIIAMVKVMNSSERNLMSTMKASFEEENKEATEATSTGDGKSFLAAYISKAKKNKLEARRRRNKKLNKAKKRLEQLGIQL